MKIGRFSALILILVVVFSLGLLLLLQASPGRYFFGLGGLANFFGFLALGFIPATAVLMLFKKPLASWMGSPERLWKLHVLIAGAGGVFLGLHVVFLLGFPLSLPVLLGYVGTGAALFVWLTGGVFFQGVRNSMFAHGVLSIAAIFLMILHTFGSARNIPMNLSGVSLVIIGVALVAGVSLKLVQVWRSESLRT